MTSTMVTRVASVSWLALFAPCWCGLFETWGVSGIAESNFVEEKCPENCELLFTKLEPQMDGRGKIQRVALQVSRAMIHGEGSVGNKNTPGL